MKVKSNIILTLLPYYSKLNMRYFLVRISDKICPDTIKFLLIKYQHVYLTKPNKKSVDLHRE